MKLHNSWDDLIAYYCQEQDRHPTLHHLLLCFLLPLPPSHFLAFPSSPLFATCMVLNEFSLQNKINKNFYVLLISSLFLLGYFSVKFIKLRFDKQLGWHKANGSRGCAGREGNRNTPFQWQQNITFIFFVYCH